MDSFWTRLVETEPYEFDESISDYQLWGVYLAGPWFFKNTGANFYYLGDYRNEAPHFSGVEIEVRHTFGSRIYGKFGDFDFDFEGAWQTGTFGPAMRGSAPRRVPRIEVSARARPPRSPLRFPARSGASAPALRVRGFRDLGHMQIDQRRSQITVPEKGSSPAGWTPHLRAGVSRNYAARYDKWRSF